MADIVIPKRSKIIDFLSKQTEPITALAIARALIGPGTPKKYINPKLYALERDGKVKRVMDGNKVLWEVSSE